MNVFKEICGKIPCKRSELDLLPTLTGGQSFRWILRHDNDSLKYRGVAYGHFWELNQSDEFLHYKVISQPNSAETHKNYDDILTKYFRLNINLKECYKEWQIAHKHFRQTAQQFQAIRMLDQEPFENILSFICSQNNNIKRISNMITWLSENYGSRICEYEGENFFSFPSLESLSKSTLETELRDAKFGYRAKYLANAVKYIEEKGGIDWLNNLRCMPYEMAREELLLVPGVGPKVADCICLMSLNHLQSIPVDTHIFKIAKEFYLPQLKKNKSLSQKTYDEIATLFRDTYGKYAGWAQTVLFCSDLKGLQRSSQ